MATRPVDPPAIKVCVSLLVAASNPRYAADPIGDILESMPNLLNARADVDEMSGVIAAAAFLVDMSIGMCAERTGATREDVTFDLRARLSQLE